MSTVIALAQGIVAGLFIGGLLSIVLVAGIFGIGALISRGGEGE